ncbi:MAG TPA: hypothetical protein VGE67_08840 [Haloferula sp.]
MENWRRRWGRIEPKIGCTTLVLVVALVGYFLAFEPLQAVYAIHRIQSATTAAEEAAALKFAHPGIWEREITEAATGKIHYNPTSSLWDAIDDPERKLRLDLEWLTGNPFGKGPFRTSLILRDNKNAYIFFKSRAD